MKTAPGRPHSVSAIRRRVERPPPNKSPTTAWPPVLGDAESTCRHAGVASDATGQGEEGHSAGAGGSVAGKGRHAGKEERERRVEQGEERKSIDDVEAICQPSPLPEGKGKTTMGTRRTVELLFCKQSG